MDIHVDIRGCLKTHARICYKFLDQGFSKFWRALNIFFNSMAGPCLTISGEKESDWNKYKKKSDEQSTATIEYSRAEDFRRAFIAILRCSPSSAEATLSPLEFVLKTNIVWDHMWAQNIFHGLVESPNETSVMAFKCSNDNVPCKPKKSATSDKRAQS